MEYKDLAIIIPTYNEQGTIGQLLNKLIRLYPGAKIFVVDDNSQDGTTEIIKDFAINDENVRLIFRSAKETMASAYIDAFARILPNENLQYLVSIDADMSHNPEAIQTFYQQAKYQGYDMVVGSRYVEGGSIKNWNWWRHFISRYGSIYTRIIAGMDIRDVTSGYVLYRRSLLLRIISGFKNRKFYAYQTEVKYLAEKVMAKWIELPITFRERESGKSKFKGNAVFEALIFPFYLRFFKKL